jgi:hypothetical protein
MCHREINTRPPLMAPVLGEAARSSDDNLLEAARALDRAALWPTRRIRAYLYSKQSAAPSNR